MKILHLIDSGGLYGAEKMLLALVGEQLNQGLEPMILSAGELGVDEKPLEREARKLKLPIKVWRMKPGLNVLGAIAILRWGKSEGFQLLHSHGYKFNILMGILPKRIRELPMVATVHGYVDTPRFGKMWLYKWLDQIALRRMSAIIFVAEVMKQKLSLGKEAEKRLNIIPNGLDFEAVLACAKKPIDCCIAKFIDRHESIVLGVGRLSAEKGFDSLIAGFEQLHMRLPGIGLLIVGEGEKRRALEEQIAKAGLSDVVMMPGFCNNIPGIMRRCSVLAMPSHTEGLPITLLEAMCMEIPVVASRVGAIPETLGEGRRGLLLAEVSTFAISDALLEVLAGRGTILSCVACAREAVEAEFSSSVMAEKYLEVYELSIKSDRSKGLTNIFERL